LGSWVAWPLAWLKTGVEPANTINTVPSVRTHWFVIVSLEATSRRMKSVSFG
jgi:hypothetical protein